MCKAFSFVASDLMIYRAGCSTRCWPSIAHLLGMIRCHRAVPLRSLSHPFGPQTSCQLVQTCWLRLPRQQAISIWFWLPIEREIWGDRFFSCECLVIPQLPSECFGLLARRGFSFSLYPENKTKGRVPPPHYPKIGFLLGERKKHPRV